MKTTKTAGLCGVACQQLAADRGTGQYRFVGRKIFHCLRKIAAYFGGSRNCDLVGKSRCDIRFMNDCRDTAKFCG